jgi:hypothetical protein
MRAGGDIVGYGKEGEGEGVIHENQFTHGEIIQFDGSNIEM